LVNQRILEKISILTQKLYEEFYKQNKSLITIYSFTFLFLVIDLTSLLITLYTRGVLKKEKEDAPSWVLVLPCIIQWFITLGFYINFKIRKKKLKFKIKKLLEEKKKSIKCYNDERAKNISKILKLQGRHFKNTYFENLLITILLFFLPIIIKNYIFRKINFKTIFSVSASLFYGYDFIFLLINIIVKTRKQRIYNQELMKKTIKNTYNSISVVDNNNNNQDNQDNNEQDNNVSLEDIDVNVNDSVIYERNKKMTSLIGEHYLNIAFLIMKSFMGILFILYFTRIGEKLDDKTSSTTWVTLFIPCYILFLPVLLFCFFHCLALYSIFKNKIWIPIITIFPCFFTFVANSVIIPLKLDNKITIHETLVTSFFAMGTIFLLIHLYVINKYKRSQN
jgi:hypothetical protein